MDLVALFGRPLQRDPQVALGLPTLRRAEKPGPLHKVQFVIELVGPRSVPASSASAILTDQWFQTLGQPEIFAMSPSDTEWRPMASTHTGSLDSLALAWDLVSERGELTSQAAAHLLRVAESFGSQIERRAMPLPPPPDINRLTGALRELKDALDIGVELMLIPKGADFSERDVWIQCAALGFDLAASGFFEFHAKGHEEPLLSVTPLGGANAFSLSSVQIGVAHPGLLIGFSLPRSLDPIFSLTSAFKVADHLSTRLDAMVFNDADQLLSPSVRNELTSNLHAAVRTLGTVGIEPGTRSALKLFS